MAPKGKGKRRNKHGNFKRKTGKNQPRSLAKKQKSHIRQFGEIHPAETSENNETKYKKVYDDGVELVGSKTRGGYKGNADVETTSDEENSEESVNPLNDLLQTFGANTADQKTASSSVEDSSDLDDENDRGKGTDEESTEETEVKTVEGTEECDNEIDEDDDDSSDPFVVHFETAVAEVVVKRMQQPDAWMTSTAEWGSLRKVVLRHLNGEDLGAVQHFLTKVPTVEPLHRQSSHVKARLTSGWHQKYGAMTPLQIEIFHALDSYRDLHFCHRTHENGESVRRTYCLHVLNHALKTRGRILKHNLKSKLRSEDGSNQFRDQGFTRPKVLILVPFRESALRVVDAIINILLPEDGADVVNKKRFFKEFGEEQSGKVKRENPDDSGRIRRKPADFEATFAGNIDDDFRLGVSVTKKSLRLFADFYSSDVIVGSPLGLRRTIEEDSDFLSSIEMVIVDQAEVIIQQNWEHVLYVFDHLNLQPREYHGADISRLRMWLLNGWAKHYRQTVVFSPFSAPEFNSIFTRRCANRRGFLRAEGLMPGPSIQSVAFQSSQFFYKFESISPSEDAESRFRFFETHIFPQFRDGVLLRGTLIFVSSYFDFVRLRNYFRQEELSFVQVSEYQDEGKVAEARDRFYHRKRKFLLYTERMHFYHRYRIKGVRHMIFYQLPMFAHFYSELLNQITQVNTMSDNSCTVLFSRYDAHRLASVVGQERASTMLNSERKVHMFVMGNR